MNQLKCSRCHKRIKDNETHYTYNLNKEYFDSESKSIVILDSFSVITLCEECKQKYKNISLENMEMCAE